MTWNQALEAGGVLVSKSLDLQIEAQAILQSLPTHEATP